MAAGKSTIAATLAAQRGAQMLAFGDLVRREAEARGVGTDRASLQDFGQELYLSLGAEGMSAALLDGYDENVVIDGVRHVEVLRALQSLRPGIVLVYLSAESATLNDRWSARQDSASRERVVNHAVESELDRLRLMATMTIDTSAITAKVAAATIDTLARN